jgi:hypothetical protein
MADLEEKRKGTPLDNNNTTKHFFPGSSDIFITRSLKKNLPLTWLCHCSFELQGIYLDLVMPLLI